jgi:hypothetical protein
MGGKEQVGSSINGKSDDFGEKKMDNLIYVQSSGRRTTETFDKKKLIAS